MSSIYQRLVEKRGDDASLKKCMAYKQTILATLKK